MRSSKAFGFDRPINPLSPSDDRAGDLPRLAWLSTGFGLAAIIEAFLAVA